MTLEVASPHLTFVDLFCGIGGFHVAAQQLDLDCVFACDIDLEAQRAYEHNFGIRPAGDINAIAPDSIPDHNILLAGFPCQPFSIIGAMKGFQDTRGTLFFSLARVIDAKRPDAFVLENVRQFSSHNQGKTLERVLGVLRELGYRTDWRVLNALDFGLPHKRERTFIVGFADHAVPFEWPEPKHSMASLSTILESDVPSEYWASEGIRNKRLEAHQSPYGLSIWHENKGGNVSSHPFSCALRAGASYNYLLVNGVRRLTPREMLRLQGFPDTFELPGTYQQVRKQTGNSVAVPVVKAVLEGVVDGLSRTETSGRLDQFGALSPWANTGFSYSVGSKQHRLLDGSREGGYRRR